MTVGGAPEFGARVAEVDVDVVAAAVLRCSSVAGLSGGIMGEVATYLPGRRVRGVVVRESPGRRVLEIHVVGRFGPTMSEISSDVRSSLAFLASDVDLEIFIDDLADRTVPPSSS